MLKSFWVAFGHLFPPKSGKGHLLERVFIRINTVVVKGPANGSPLNHFNFMGVSLCIPTPHGEGIYSSCCHTLVLYAAIQTPLCLVLMFQCFICIRGYPVYVCTKV